MTKHSATVAIGLSLVCALSACGPKTGTRSRDAAGNAPQPAVSQAVADTGTRQHAGAGTSVLIQSIGFRLDDSVLSPEAKARLAAKAAALRASPTVRLRIEGHADEPGTDQYNVALGMRRALAAKRYLVQKGVDSNRLYVISYGRKRPLDRSRSEAARALNRRVEFGIMSMRVATGR